ncbi:MAG: electron transfer flavoprotein subunit beta [Deltaproteobacteria bacterium]|nr:electron transfer flavoprotein subunit beta [Deltaproteobacteria bacterium]
MGNGHGLEVLVLLRETRDPRPPVRLLASGAALRSTGLRRVVNPADLAALEVAVARPGAVVTALAVGGEELDDALRLGLSMGAARAIRIWDEALRDGDAVAEARVLRRTLEILRPTLFLTGSSLLDRGDDASAALAGAGLGMACARQVVSLALERGRALAIRRAEKGWREEVELRLPCTVLVDAGAAEPRYPDLPSVLGALAAPVAVWGLAELGLPAWELGFDGAALRPVGLAAPRSDPLRVETPDPSQPAHERVRSLFSGGIRPRQGRVHLGSAGQAVERILAIFAEEGLLPGGGP